MSVPTHKQTWGRSAARLLVAVVLCLVGAGFVLRAAEEPNKDVPKKVVPKKERPGLPHFDPFEDLPNLDMDGAELQKRLQAMRERMSRFSGLRGQPHAGRLGAMVAQPSETLADQLDLPKDRGLVIEEVRPGSAADKAGLKVHDILLEFAGKPVPNNPQAFVKDLGAIKADAPVDVVILRKGKREALAGLKLPEARPAREEKRNLKEQPPPFARPEQAPDQGVMISVERMNDRFTATRREGEIVITIRGKVADGKATAGEIGIVEGKVSNKYAGIDKVPESHRAAVKQLLERVGNEPKRPAVDDF